MLSRHRSPTTASLRHAPFQTARLTEAQVQELLEFAIGPGGLGIARGSTTPAASLTLHRQPSPSVPAAWTRRSPSAHSTSTTPRMAPTPCRGRRSRPSPSDCATSIAGGSPHAAYVPAAYRGILSDGGGGLTSDPRLALDDVRARRVHLVGRPEQPADPDADADRRRRRGARGRRPRGRRPIHRLEDVGRKDLPARAPAAAARREDGARPALSRHVRVALARHTPRTGSGAS